MVVVCGAVQPGYFTKGVPHPLAACLRLRLVAGMAFSCCLVGAVSVFPTSDLWCSLLFIASAHGQSLPGVYQATDSLLETRRKKQ